MTHPLTESVLRRLTAEAFLSFLSESEKFEAVVSPGCAMALCNEPVADLNGIIVGHGASEEHFAAACRTCLSREQPFLAIVFPEAGERIEEVAVGLGLVHAVDFPFMVRKDSPIEPTGSDAVVVERASGNEAVLESARRFFLGATPAGYRLYESLGFETRVAATVWVSGETSQA